MIPIGNDKYRGHLITETTDALSYWVYSDIGIAVSAWKDRPCGHCGLANTPEGHDGCLGTLPNVMNACCGHGNDREAYVQYWDSSSVHGIEAISVIEKLKEVSE